ncbi:MAG TPA: cobaltochelatase subunit CobN, partial [Negativicutes bacterium]|nr:cobaltochelatase subunit CobN [Negativicutes bacterium]
MEILFITNLTRQAGMMEKTRKQLALSLDFPPGRAIMADPRMVWDDTWEKQLSNASVTLISWMGSSSDSKLIQQTLKFLRESGKPYLLMGSGVDQTDTAIGFMVTDIETVNRYLLFSGQHNFRNLWRWLAGRFCGHEEKTGEPREIPWCGILNPQDNQRIDTLAEYRRQGWLQKDRLTVGLLIPRDEWVWGDLKHQNLLIKTLMARGLNVIPVFSHWAADPIQQSTGVDTAIENYFRDESGWIVDVVINTLKFSLTVGRPIDISFFQRLDRPILQAYTLLQSETMWRDNLEGLTPLDLSFSVSLPEFD